MTKNEWLTRQLAEQQIMRNHIVTLIEYCWYCFVTDGQPPTEAQAELIARDVIQLINDDIDKL